MTDGREGELPPGQRLSDLRVKHYGRVPAGEPETWTTVFGVDRGLDDGSADELGRLTAGELATWPQTEVVADLHCASGWTARDLTWQGVPTAAVLQRFPPPAGTVGVMAYAQYGYSANVRLADLLQPTTLLATGLNGKPLPREHGFPLRLVVPHLYAHKSPKWFRGWEYLVRPRRGFWEQRGYHLVGDPWAEERYSYME